MVQSRPKKPKGLNWRAGEETRRLMARRNGEPPGGRMGWVAGGSGWPQGNQGGRARRGHTGRPPA